MKREMIQFVRMVRFNSQSNSSISFGLNHASFSHFLCMYCFIFVLLVVVIYNAIINACAYTIGDAPEQREAMDIAHNTLQELEKSPYAKADQITYGTFLKVCENQMPPSDTRLQLVKLVFHRCAKEGQVGKFVFDQLKSILTPEEYKEITRLRMNNDESDWKDIPLEWRCNVIEGKKRRRRNLDKSK